MTDAVKSDDEITYRTAEAIPIAAVLEAYYHLRPLPLRLVDNEGQVYEISHQPRSLTEEPQTRDLITSGGFGNVTGTARFDRSGNGVITTPSTIQ